MSVAIRKSLLIMPLVYWLALTSASAREYPSPDDTLIAVVNPITNHQSGESQIQIRRRSGQILYEKSYGSPDGQHGEIVDEAKWTPNSQFFVFSMYSSGGHQPWYSPIASYSRELNSISLIDSDGLVTTDLHFRVFSPSSIEVFGHSNSVADDTWIRLDLLSR